MLSVADWKGLPHPQAGHVSCDNLGFVPRTLSVTFNDATTEWATVVDPQGIEP